MALLCYMKVLPQRNTRLPDSAVPFSTSLLLMAIDKQTWLLHVSDKTKPRIQMQREGPISKSVTNLQRVEKFPGKKLGVCKNKSGENLTQCCCDKFD